MSENCDLQIIYAMTWRCYNCGDERKLTPKEAERVYEQGKETREYRSYCLSCDTEIVEQMED